jgi:hypothetical protein
MENTKLFLVLFLSAIRNAELEQKVKGFERIAKVLSKEVDRQQKEIESMKQQKLVKFNHLRKFA